MRLRLLLLAGAAGGLLCGRGFEARTDVVVFRELVELERLSGLNAPGFFQQGTDANFIAVAWSGGGDPMLAPRNLRQIPCTLGNVEVNVVYRPLADFGSLNGDLVALVF